jgi:hypothetical protein
MASRSLLDCVPELVTASPLICNDYNALFVSQGFTLKPICTLRSSAEQLELFKHGRVVKMVNGVPVVVSVRSKLIVTKIDGITQFSKHNPTPLQPLSRAIDFGVFKGGSYITDDQYYEPLLDLARHYGLRSGWDFTNTGLPIEKAKRLKVFIDPPHVEVKE